MKKLYIQFILLMLLFPLVSNGQIISQYIETSSGKTPKGIEIWNNTASEIDFSQTNLIIEKGTNGASPAADFTLAEGTLASGAVLVIGTSDMQAETESNSAVFYTKGFTFNGNDALVVKLGDVTTDVFGTPESDPGSEWTGADVSTMNQNIALKQGISIGDIDGWTDPSERFETVSTDNSLTGFGIAPTDPGGFDVEDPVITPEGATFVAQVLVSISCSTAGAEIFYTLDESEPTATSTPYSNPFTLTETATVKAIAISNNVSSNVAVQTYTIEPAEANLPVITFVGFECMQTLVEISCANSEAAIYYTLDGNDPTSTSVQYTDTLKVDADLTIKAISIVHEVVSEVVVAVTIAPEMPPLEVPVISPDGGEFSDSVLIEINTIQDDTEIYYAIVGDEATEQFERYGGAFYLKESKTVKAYTQTITCEFQSDQAQQTYTINQPTIIETIAGLRALPTEKVKFTGTATLTLQQDYRNQKWIQDETGGLLIDDGNGRITASFELGNGITNLQGTVSEYKGLVQFVPETDATLIENPDFIPSVQDVTIAQLKSSLNDYESELVRIISAQFTEAGTFENVKNYPIHNGSDTMILRTNIYDLDYIGMPFSLDVHRITGIVIDYDGTAQITPRNAADIESVTSNPQFKIEAKVFGAENKVVLVNPLGEPLHISVFSISGKIVAQSQSSNFRIELPIAHKGLYLVQLQNKQGVKVAQKVILK